jgi:hypothetical protein
MCLGSRWSALSFWGGEAIGHDFQHYLSRST